MTKRSTCRRLVAVGVCAVLLCACAKTPDTFLPMEESPASQVAVIEPDEESAVSESAMAQSSVSNDATEDLDIEFVLVDQSKVKVSDAIAPGHGYRGNREQAAAERVSKSYETVWCQSYEDTWFRTYELYLPQFTDEITGEGAEKIKQFYSDRYKNAGDGLEDFQRGFGIGDKLIDSASDKDLFLYQDYAVKQFAPYLAVTYTSVTYMGGAHGLSNIAADNFDTRTGELLTFADVFGDGAPPALVEAVQSALPDSVIVAPDGEMISAAPFRVTEEGVEFIFNEYEIAPFSAGTICACIPWETAAPLMRIDPPEIPAQTVIS